MHGEQSPDACVGSVAKPKQKRRHLQGKQPPTCRQEVDRAGTRQDHAGLNRLSQELQLVILGWCQVGPPPLLDGPAPWCTGAKWGFAALMSDLCGIAVAWLTLVTGFVVLFSNTLFSSLQAFIR